MRKLMNMRKRMNDHALLVLVTVGLAVMAAAGPTLAATVYTWTTEDGTKAFTDDPKRIPAKYKDQVERRQLGKLKNYPRYTESKVKHESTYEKRVAERLERLRTPAPPAVSAPPPGVEGGARYAVGLSEPTQDQVSVPVGGLGEEPFETTEHRIRTRESIATQDLQITRQGDKVISVRISAPNQRGIEEDVDY